MATAAERQPVVIEESAASKVLRVLGRAPVHLVLVVIGLMWLIPTLGLFITSLLTPSDQAEGGWWNFLLEPSTWTLENYRNMFDNEGIVDALIIWPR